MSEQINGQPVAPTPPVPTPPDAVVGANTNVENTTPPVTNPQVVTLEGEAKTLLLNTVAEIRALADKLEAGIK